MKFDIPKIVRPLALSEYATEYGDLVLQVWVNPPVRLLQEHDRILDDVRQGLKDSALEGHTALGVIEHAANELITVFAELWSQGEADTRWTADEVRTLVDETQDSDPQLWPWLRNRTIDLIREHRTRLKKD